MNVPQELEAHNVTSTKRPKYTSCLYDGEDEGNTNEGLERREGREGRERERNRRA